MRFAKIRKTLASLFRRGDKSSFPAEKQNIEEQCNTLLTTSGDISGTQTASAILKNYNSLDQDERIAFFKFLTDSLDIDCDEVIKWAVQYRGNPSTNNFKELVAAAEPRRQILLSRLNQAPDATINLIRMRSDLLKLTKQYEEFKRTDISFEHILSNWFNRGFLKLQPIDWNSPANILEKIIQYEAVHEIKDIEAVKRRTKPYDRRCYAFFHTVIPDEPLTFVQVAFTRGIPGSIQNILSEEREILTSEQIDTAVFYSISDCQEGLKRVPFGNFLIKQVVDELARELPQLRTFVTLSPMPGFRSWLETNEALNSEIPEILMLIKPNMSNENLDQLGAKSKLLRSLAAKYILDAKRARDQFPMDPVTRFHLRNGASVYNVHALADISKKGITQSCGVMVNYLYKLDDVTANHEKFVAQKIIETTKEIRGLAKFIK